MILVLLPGCGNEEEPRSAEEATRDASSVEVEPAAEAPGEQREAARPVSYRRDVYPIFEAKCVICHHPNNAVKVILTDPFDPSLGLIDRPNSWTRSAKRILVVPGDPDASALILKVEAPELDHDVEGDPMPWAIPRVTETELTVLREWIDAGAADDAVYRTSIVRLFGDGVSLGSRGGKCAYCHHGGPEGQRPDLTSVFDPVTGAVGVPADRGGVRIVPGSAATSVVYLRVSATEMPPSLAPLMPRHYDRLTLEEIGVLREWIALGARND